MGRSMRPLRSVFVTLAALAMTAAADARTVRDQPYSRDNTWNAAIRLIRVDLGCRITERDVDNGYFTFDWRDGRRTVPGSLEVIPTQIDGRPGTRVIVQISDMPGYVESMVLTQLSRKLHADFGEPPTPPRAPPPPGPAPSEPPRQPGSPVPPEPGLPTPPPEPPRVVRDAPAG
jgi:hypothetical protein